MFQTQYILDFLSASRSSGTLGFSKHWDFQSKDVASSLREGYTYTQWPPWRKANKLRGECSYHTPIRVVLPTKKLSSSPLFCVFISAKRKACRLVLNHLCPLKGTVSRDFRPTVFSSKHPFWALD
jgi:hypothetical protein